ncbi:hypothetical protein LCGC14_1800210 [marine sediment metagenome]|uniref:Uncharacterized protein n=1 Tax=marine sediment metagenome TaxID=412755 RepID=A0A0F9JPI5_9ZZZZ
MIVAILKDKRGFELKIKIPERLPRVYIPIPTSPEFIFNVDDSGYGPPSGETVMKKQTFLFKKMLKKRTALYEEI